MNRWLLAVVAVSSLAPIAEADAFPVHRRMFRSTYDKAVRCELCHARGGGNRRNAYGDAWFSAGETIEAFRKIESADSDGDGVVNIVEIEGGSNPGDPRSTPDNPGRRWKASQRVPIPKGQLELVFGHPEKIEAVEIDVDDAKAAKIAKALGRPPREEERFPTLYFAVNDGRRSAVALFGHRQTAEGRFTVLVSLDAKAKVDRVAIFRAGKSDGTDLMPYARCLQGYGVRDLPRAGESGCPRGAGTEPIRLTVQSALATAAAALSR